MFNIDWDKIESKGIQILKSKPLILPKPFGDRRSITALAAEKFNVPRDKVTKKMREIVKLETFSERYGMIGCSSRGCPLCEAGVPRRRHR